MQVHNCPGPGWNPVRTIPAPAVPSPDFYPVESQGLLTETMIYSDFKKLIKRDTLAKFRDRFIGRLENDEATLTEEAQPMVWGIDAIADIFDAVAKGFHDDNSV